MHISSSNATDSSHMEGNSLFTKICEGFYPQAIFYMKKQIMGDTQFTYTHIVVWVKLLLYISILLIFVSF